MTVWRSHGGSPAMCMSGLITIRLRITPIAEAPMLVKKNRLLEIRFFLPTSWIFIKPHISRIAFGRFLSFNSIKCTIVVVVVTSNRCAKASWTMA